MRWGPVQPPASVLTRRALSALRFAQCCRQDDKTCANAAGGAEGRRTARRTPQARLDGVSCKKVRAPAAPVKPASASRGPSPRANETPLRAETCAVIRVSRAVIRAALPALFVAGEAAKSEFSLYLKIGPKRPRAHANRRAKHARRYARHRATRTAGTDGPRRCAIG